MLQSFTHHKHGVSWRTLLLGLLVLVAFMVAPVFAQEAPPTLEDSLIVFANDQFLVGDVNGVTNFDACTPDEAVRLPMIPSPDGNYFIAITEPRAVTDTIAAIGGVGGGPLPSNAYLCDVATGTLTKIADQPADFAFFSEDRLDAFVTRSMPAFSPDGASIAWAEMAHPSFVVTVQTLNLATLESNSVVVALPEPFGIPVAPIVYWFDEGLAALVYDLDDVTFQATTELHFFDASGAITSEVLIHTEGETSEFIDQYLPVRYEGAMHLALRFSESGWFLVEPTSGARLSVAGLPALTMPNVPNSLQLLFDVDENYNMNWRAVGGANERSFPNYMMGRIALSPDGQRVAFAGGVLEVWNSVDNSVVAVPNTDGFADDFLANVVWGNGEWVWVSNAPVAQVVPQSVTCEGTQPSRLTPNTLARVAEATIPNNVRDAASTAGTLVGQIPGGATFTVIQGPVCADGYAWYEIQFGDLIGWTAEGTSDTYWLEPLQ
jgi:hypothetical protein